MKNKILFATIISTFIGFSFSAKADTAFAGYVNTAGCHQINGTCYASLDSGPIRLPECPNGGDVRWDDADTENGKRTYASILSAFLTNTRIELVVGGCTAQGYPALRYYRMSR